MYNFTPDTLFVKTFGGNLQIFIRIYQKEVKHAGVDIS